jgi:hypothetical protein
MKRYIPALSLLVAVLTSSGSGVASIQQLKVISLAAKSGATIATIRVSPQSLLYEFNDNADAVLFTDQAYFMLNRKDKTYRVQSYADLQEIASRKTAEIANSPQPADAAKGVAFNLTQDMETISGVMTRKLIKTRGGETEAEFWVSSELLPPNLRTFGERLRTILPKDYWNRVHGNPGMIEIVTLFGVPLKATFGHETYEAKVVESPGSDSQFQVPDGYKKLDN